MDGWLGILVFAALFFLMMRFGCGMHMMHGRGKEAGGSHAGHAGCDGGHEAAPGEAASIGKPSAAPDGPATMEGGKS